MITELGSDILNIFRKGVMQKNQDFKKSTPFSYSNGCLCCLAQFLNQHKHM